MTEPIGKPAQLAGIIVPDDMMDYDREQYPYWAVYQNVQSPEWASWLPKTQPVGRPGSKMQHHQHRWENARIIASIPDNSIRTVTIADLGAMGVM